MREENNIREVEKCHGSASADSPDTVGGLLRVSEWDACVLRVGFTLCAAHLASDCNTYSVMCF